MKQTILVAGCLFCLFMLIACSPANTSQELTQPVNLATITATNIISSPTPTSTSTATPTLTPSPSFSPTFTSTPLPTLTRTPSPTPIGGGPGQIAFHGRSGIELLNVATRRSIPLGIWGNWLAWYQDGKTLSYLGYVSRENLSEVICSYDIRTRNMVCLQLDATYPSLPYALSPNTGILALSSYEQVYIINLKESTQEIIVEGSDPTFSPDGTMIAFTKDGRVYTMKSDGSDQKMIVSSTGNNNLSWSPRGDLIAYTAYKNGNDDVFTATLDGAQTRRSFSADYDGYTAWSPDGSKLAYITAYSRSYSGLYGDVVVIDIDNNDASQITHAVGATSASPSWSPDGQWLTFGGCKAGQADTECAVFVIRSDGSELLQLTDYKDIEIRPVWQP